MLSLLVILGAAGIYGWAQFLLSFHHITLFGPSHNAPGGRNQCIYRGSYGDRLRQFSVHRLPERDFRPMAIGPAPVPSVALSANLPAGSAAVRLRALRRVLCCLPDCNLRRPCRFALALHEEKSRTMDSNILAVVVPGRVDQRV